MILSTHQNLDELIVTVLSSERTASVDQIHKLVNKFGRTYSRPAIYKEVRKLQEIGVAVRSGNQIKLTMSWVRRFTEFADKLYDTYIEPPTLESILPTDSKAKKFYFSNLRNLDDFWIDCLILMLQHSKKKQIYQWIPHPWFNLVHSQKTVMLIDALKSSGSRINCIIGGNYPLDKKAEKFTNSQVFEFNYSPSTFQGERSNYIAVSDRFLLKISLTKKKSEEIDSFYESVLKFSDLNLNDAIDLITKAKGTSLTLETNKNKIKKHWNMFIDHFHVSNDEKL